MNIRFRAPVTVSLDVTSRCNLECTYCSVNASPKRPDELDASEMATLVRSLIDYNVLRILITGGEPFVRADIFDILRALRLARRLVRINTNGTLLTQQVCARLKELNVTDISVSLDGGNSTVNDATRGRGSFSRASQGARNLVESGIHPCIMLTLTRHNFQALEETVDACRAVGASSLSINAVYPVGRGAERYESLRLRPEEWQSVAQTIQALKMAHPGFVHDNFVFWSMYPEKLKEHNKTDALAPGPSPPPMLPCDAGKASCAIESDGCVLPCKKFHSYRCGNVRNESLISIWRGPAMERIRNLAATPVSHSEICGACAYNVVCVGGCRADAYNAFGNLEAPDPACAILADSAIHGVTPCVDLVERASPVCSPRLVCHGTQEI